MTRSPVRAGQAGTEILSKFIFGPEPDHRIRAFKLHTVHRFSKNRFFENLYKSLFQAKTCQGTTQNMPRSSPNDPQNIQHRPKIDQKSIKNRPSIRQKSTNVDSFSYINLFSTSQIRRFLKFCFGGSHFRVHSSKESMFHAQSTSNIENRSIISFIRLSQVL